MKRSNATINLLFMEIQSFICQIYVDLFDRDYTFREFFKKTYSGEQELNEEKVLCWYSIVDNKLLLKNGFVFYIQHFGSS